MYLYMAKEDEIAEQKAEEASEEEEKEAKNVPQKQEKSENPQANQETKIKQRIEAEDDQMVAEKSSGPKKAVDDKKHIKSYPAGDVTGRKRFPYTKRFSYFAKNPDAPIDYKRVDILVKFLSDKGKITPRRFTRLTALQQRRVAKAIKRARHAGLLPFCIK